MHRRRAHPGRMAASAAAALALAACGGRAAPPVRVEIRDFVFTPASAAVKAGGTVVFVNHDAVPHTATAVDRSWDSGNIASNDSAVVTVTRPGAYKCSYHPTMAGVLTTAK